MCPLIVDNDCSQIFFSVESSLIFAVMFLQKAAVVYKMAVSCITTQLIVD